MKQSAPEAEFLLHCRANKLKPKTEFRFNPSRKWRLDFAFPDQKLGIEINGGIWRVSGHTTGTGLTRDYEKGNSAILLGWRVLNFTPAMVKSGEAIKIVMECLTHCRISG